MNTIIGGLAIIAGGAIRPSKGMVAERKAKRQQEIAENLTPALPSKRTSRVCKQRVRNDCRIGRASYKMTKNLTHRLVGGVRPAMTEAAGAVFAQNDVAGFPAELDIAERTEEHVQMVSLEKFIAFAKASGLSAVTYDVTYFPPCR